MPAHSSSTAHLPAGTSSGFRRRCNHGNRKSVRCCTTFIRCWSLMKEPPGHFNVPGKAAAYQIFLLFFFETRFVPFGTRNILLLLL